ncbi:hypothetical protein DFH06DRAFT_1319215 [Mycena polygramma]|nr:hypothetical protein DFH06DRAFT_1319215 [Mycena polygramma]
MDTIQNWLFWIWKWSPATLAHVSVAATLLPSYTATASIASLMYITRECGDGHADCEPRERALAGVQIPVGVSLPAAKAAGRLRMNAIPPGYAAVAGGNGAGGAGVGDGAEAGCADIRRAEVKEERATTTFAPTSTRSRQAARPYWRSVARTGMRCLGRATRTHALVDPGGNCADSASLRPPTMRVPHTLVGRLLKTFSNRMEIEDDMNGFAPTKKRRRLMRSYKRLHARLFPARPPPSG